MKSKMKSKVKSKKKSKATIVEVEDEKINQIITNTRNKYAMEASSVKTGEKVVVLKDCCWELLTDISKAYYPESKFITSSTLNSNKGCLDSG